MKNQTKRQHTVPKCFLKNFSDSGHSLHKRTKKDLTPDELKRELNKPTPLKTATTIDDFYTLRTGNDPMLVETLIYANEIENRYPEIYQLLIDPNREGYDMMERTWLLTCLLSMHCRTSKQFRYFESILPEDVKDEIDNIREDYKVYHVNEVLTKVIEAHQFKRIIVLKITDNSEFITSDNPVLIIGNENGESVLKNHEYREQFNRENIIAIPIDKKHCVVLTHTKDRNGIRMDDKLFYNKIERKDITANEVYQTNWFMLDSADKYYYGSEKYMKAYFNFINIID
jgi:hypothetical protein